MSRIRLPPSKSEIVAAIGRRVGQRRKIAVLATYLPPAMKSQQVRRSLRDVNDAIIHIKQKYMDTYILIAVDFNKANLDTALTDHADIKVIRTGPTCGTNVLDIISSNLNNMLIESGTTDPIRSENDIPSII